jgi:dTDP-glucose pyrophosphorylase
MEQEKISVVVLAAGQGTRFEGSSYSEHKTLIPVRGEKMSVLSLKNTVANLGQLSYNTVFMSSSEIVAEDATLEADVVASGANDVRFFSQDAYLNGPAETALEVKKYVRKQAPLLLANADQYVSGSFVDGIVETLSNEDIDGALFCFTSSEDRYSYVTVDENNLATDIKEKVVISDIASTGICLWKTASEFFETAEATEVTEGSELFISDVYAKAIADGKKFIVVMVDAFIDMGTPADLEEFDTKWAAI